MAVEADIAVIGAYIGDGKLADTGSAYVNRLRSGQWVEEQELTANDAAAYDYFGGRVAMSGNVAVIGASGNDGAAAEAGAAYVFRYDGSRWVEEQKLTASDAAGAVEALERSVQLQGGGRYDWLSLAMAPERLGDDEAAQPPPPRGAEHR